MQRLGRTAPPTAPESIAPGTDPIDPMKDAKLLVRFDGSDGDSDWYTLNDDVMGGISR